jgi:hypothetical protein
MFAIVHLHRESLSKLRKTPYFSFQPVFYDCQQLLFTKEMLSVFYNFCQALQFQLN